MSDVPSLSDLVALSLLPSWCWRHAAEQLALGAPPAAVLDRLTAARPGARANAAALRERAAEALRRGASGGLIAIARAGDAYPAALTTLVDPPFVLWTRGMVAALQRPAVAIVGSRAASPYGIAVAERLAGDLASRGVAVVSGLARGVDSAAHRGALRAGGVTIAVLGSGVDVVYPPEHAALAVEIAADGLVLSELVPGTPPLKPFFPLRNRIISGLSRAVVVVEAGEKSGSLITARCALEQGRDVLAVPGNILGGRNRGAHALLRDGARIVDSADDILDEIGVRPSPRGAPEGADADRVLGALVRGEPADLDAISERSGIGARELLPRLFELELQGLVARAGGGRFVRS